MEKDDLSEEQQLETIQNCDYEGGSSTSPPRLELLTSSVTPEN